MGMGSGVEQEAGVGKRLILALWKKKNKVDLGLTEKMFGDSATLTTNFMPLAQFDRLTR